MPSYQLPDFDGLPPVPNTPKGCAWGIFDQNGKRDQVGTLNLLTPDIVLEAVKEVRVGESVALNWDLSKPAQPFCREAFEHHIKDLREELKLPIYSYDDVIKINTQASSQWDGFRHWGDPKTGRYYNGLQHDGIASPENTDNSIHYWSARGGIVGRGILVDYASWAAERGINIKPGTTHIITLEAVLMILQEKNVTLKVGDILLIRSGLIQMYEACRTEAERKALLHTPKSIGLEASERTVRWLWDQHFAAVAGDAVAFESQPFASEYSLHDFLLVWWGMPIGELWDLEALAKRCKQHNRWTFLLTSSPLNILKGVASPPNALALF